MNWVEGLGILSSAIIVGGFAFSSERRIRLANMVGAFLFGVYGLLIGSPPVVVTNWALVLLNAYKLFMMRWSR